jgi:hypothetical protein
MNGTTEIAQPDYEMFERNIIHLTRRAREVSVRLGAGGWSEMEPAEGPGSGSSRLYVGFLAGLDEGYLQLCRTDNQLLVLIDRDAVTEIEATGRILWRLEEQGMSPNAVKRITEACQHFINVARAVSDSKGRSSGSR